jgi:hypothetical protein
VNNPTKAERLRVLAERMRNAMRRDAGIGSNSLTGQDSRAAQKEFFALVESIASEPGAQASAYNLAEIREHRINACADVLRAAVGTNWAHDQALSELLDYARAATGATA